VKIKAFGDIERFCKAVVLKGKV